MSSPLPLSVQSVTKRYGKLTALSDVSLEVAPGEIFALLGPNGAGKTTLIGCVGGMSRQTEGAIRIFGYDTIADYRVTRRLVGIVPQEINFDPFFTPYESLMIQMGLMGVRPDRAWAEELLSMFSLADKRDAYTRSLSGGMKRRLLVAKALVHEPRLLFLDEPTAGVDVELRKDLWAQVQRLREGGTTIVLTTHYLEEAEQLADRVGIIHRGKVVVVEDTASLLRRHAKTRWKLVGRAPFEDVPALGGGQATLDAQGALIMSETDPARVAEAIAAANRAMPLVDVTVERTRLEDVFMTLIEGA